MIQIDMEMPRGCYECPFGDESFQLESDYYCQAAKKDVVYGLSKPDLCPLIDVPDIHIGKSSDFPNSDDVFVTVDEAIDLIEKACDTWEFEYATSDEDWWSEVHKACDMAVKALKQPEIIYCKDCKFRIDGKCYVSNFESGLPCMIRWVKANDFCSMAERRINGSD